MLLVIFSDISHSISMDGNENLRSLVFEVDISEAKGYIPIGRLFLGRLPMGRRSRRNARGQVGRDSRLSANKVLILP